MESKLKIVVCVKQVTVLPGPVVLINGDTDVDPLFTRRRLNDPDVYAVEEALRLCESHGDGEVVVLAAPDNPEPIDILKNI